MHECPLQYILLKLMRRESERLGIQVGTSPLAMEPTLFLSGPLTLMFMPP